MLSTKVDLWFDVNDDCRVHLESKNFDGLVDLDFNQPSQVKEGHCGDYARSAKYALRKRFNLSKGINGVIQGSLPVGGLSSTAAVLIAYVITFAEANDDIFALMTEWHQFRMPSWNVIMKVMTGNVIVDGRNFMTARN